MKIVQQRHHLYIFWKHIWIISVSFCIFEGCGTRSKGGKDLEVAYDQEL